MQDYTYEGIRADLVDALKKSGVFKDYNFDASGISALVNFLAYNDHRFAYMTKMLLDESFVDTAHTLQAMLSHAKRLGYNARGVHASVAELAVVIRTPLQYSGDNVEIPRGTTFKSSNSQQDTRVFTVLTNHVAQFVKADATARIFEAKVLVNEGVISQIILDVLTELVNQQYSVGDPDMDSSTMGVYVRIPGSTVETKIERAGTPQDVNPAYPVYYTMLNRDASLSVIMSEAYPQATQIRVEYLKTSGSTGNGANSFAFVKQQPRSSIDINNFTDVKCTVDAPSQGGADIQSIDEMRVAIPLSWRRQNRAVTSEDVASIIREEFGDVSTVNVWGGEEEKRRRYGKKFICVVPKSSRVLSLGARREIARLLAKYKMPADDLVFVDAAQQLVDIVVTVKRLPTASSDEEVEKAALAVIDEMTGISTGTSILNFSSYAIASEIKRRVPDVSQAYPSVTLYNELTFRDISAVEIDFGNEVHSPPQIASDVKVAVVKQSPSVLVFTPSAPGSAKIVTTPVVPELRVSRNQYFEVRSRKVKVVR